MVDFEIYKNQIGLSQMKEIEDQKGSKEKITVNLNVNLQCPASVNFYLTSFDRAFNGMFWTASKNMSFVSSLPICLQWYLFSDLTPGI
jgi:hypothetical protein